MNLPPNPPRGASILSEVKSPSLLGESLPRKAGDLGGGKSSTGKGQKNREKN